MQSCWNIFNIKNEIPYNMCGYLIFLEGYVPTTKELMKLTLVKIDGAIATIMGLDRAIRCGSGADASVYDNRGILFA